MNVEKPARVHFIPDLKVWAFVTLRAPIAVKQKDRKKIIQDRPKAELKDYSAGASAVSRP